MFEKYIDFFTDSTYHVIVLFSLSHFFTETFLIEAKMIILLIITACSKNVENKKMKDKLKFLKSLKYSFCIWLTGVALWSGKEAFTTVV